MHIHIFLQDLAVVMIVAGAVTVLFHRLNQPVVLGYIIAGLILGPNTPPFSFIYDEPTIKTLAELGVIFLMFSLGLEFSVMKLFKVGAAALIAAVTEIIFMILVGYEIGMYFGWGAIDSLFLGATLAISSSTIIIRALEGLGLKKKPFAQTIFGILIIEDILAIAILALLSSLAVTGAIEAGGVVLTLGKLMVFLVFSMVVGIMFVPRVLGYVAKFKNDEMLLITVLALCFGFSLLVIQLDYSVALGAFLVGAMVAESQHIKHIEKLVEPLTNMFSAIFFVSIGLLVDPKIMHEYMVPITVITLAVIIGKVLICSLSVFFAGRDGRTSMRVGMGLAQIGEFSFIIAGLGVSLDVTSPFLYPVVVAVSAITTFTTPYLIKFADPVSDYLAKKMPVSIAQVFIMYTAWLQNIKTDNSKVAVMHALKMGLLQIFINLIFIMAFFIGGSYLSHGIHGSQYFIVDLSTQRAVIYGAAIALSLPFMIAIYLKLRALSMIAAEMTMEKCDGKKFDLRVRRNISKIIPVLGISGVVLIMLALSASILPPLSLLLVVVITSLVMTVLLWRWFVRLHSQLQKAFMVTFEDKK